MLRDSAGKLDGDVAVALLREAGNLKRQGKLEQALELNWQAVRTAPLSGVAEHNLAATLCDLSLFGEAEAAAVRAICKGTDAPETHLVRARALQALERLDEAEASFEAAIKRRRSYVEAHRELAQLRWMRGDDVSAAARVLDSALCEAPAAGELVLLKASLLAAAGDHFEAVATLERTLPAARRDVVVASAIHQAIGRNLAILGEAEAQLKHALQALRLTPSSIAAAITTAEALLHNGKHPEAERLLRDIEVAAPDNQAVKALRSTTWRLLGDPRHNWLEDPAQVSAALIEAPSGWGNLQSYLADLAAVLIAWHPWRNHPLDLSLRHGSQTQQDLAGADDPTVRALFAALDEPIRKHISNLGRGSDPVRSRNSGDYKIVSAWSVLLRPGGHHVDHIHSQGWLSSAFYVEVPDAVDRGREGWLALGRPGVPTRPTLTPFRHIRPEAGTLVMFPSSLWHGTEPFGGASPRLTVAFDLLPA